MRRNSTAQLPQCVSIMGYHALGRADSRIEISAALKRAPGPDICVHRITAISADETTRHENLPVTTPARTLLDLAQVLDTRELERALSVAERQGLLDRDAMMLLLARHPRRRGTPALRALLGDAHAPALTRSEAEARFLALLRKARLRLPETNVILNGYEVDCLWRSERLIAEIDGFAFHSSKDAFERDRRRDAVLTGAGFRVIRLTWRQLTHDSHALLVAVAQAQALAHRSVG